MVEQVEVPQTVVEVCHKVPNKLKNHAVEELFIFEGQGENIGYFNAFRLLIWIFLCFRLNKYLYQHQQESKISEYDDEGILMGGVAEGVCQKAAEQQNNAGEDG